MLPGYPWQISSRWTIPQSNDWKWSKRRCLSTLLRTKIIPTLWPHKNISITKVIGGFVRTRQVPILCQCSADLTSNKHCLPCSNWKEKKKKLIETNDGHKVLLLLHGGVGKVLGGLLILMKVTMEMRWTKYWLNRATCYTSIWSNSSRHDILEFIYFVTDWSFTADVGLL